MAEIQRPPGLYTVASGIDFVLLLPGTLLVQAYEPRLAARPR